MPKKCEFKKMNGEGCGAVPLPFHRPVLSPRFEPFRLDSRTQGPAKKGPDPFTSVWTF